MEDNNKNENSENIVRRSKRLAAKTEDVRNQLLNVVLADLERDSSAKKKNDSNFNKKKLYRNTAPKTRMRSETSGTLFDSGLQATAIIGATYVDDDTKGTSELCYLVKYENGQFELVLNSVAHKHCPKLIIDFLESRILFKEKDDLDLARELFTDNFTATTTTTATNITPPTTTIDRVEE